MTDFADFKTEIAEWANRQDWSDILVTSFVRAAEQQFNDELRVDRMLAEEDAMIFACCAPLPTDWIMMDLVRLEDSAGRFCPIRYMPRDMFFRLPDTPTTSSPSINNSTFGYYTLEGRQIYVGGPPDGVNGHTLRIDYYQEVPVFSDDLDSWVYTKYPALYRYAALTHADLHAVGEEDKAGGLKMLVADMIKKLNDNHQLSRASGSRLARRRVRSFG